MNPEKLGKDIAKFLLMEEITETVAIYPGAFKPPHKGHVDVILKALNFSLNNDRKVNGPTMPSSTQTPGKAIVFVSEKTRENVDYNESLAVWDLYKEAIPELNNVEFISTPTPVTDVYHYVKENPTHNIKAVFGKGEESRFERLQDKSKYPHVELFNAGTFQDLSATNLRKAISNKDKETIKTFIPDGVDVDEFLSIFQSNEGLYPKYNYKKVQQTRYKASDVWTNDPDITEKKDPKKGTGKKPKGSSRRLYTDEDPKDTVGVKFSSRQDIVDTFNKKSFKAKSHARQSQVINLVHQRVRAAYNRAKDPAVKKRLKTALAYAEKRKEASKKKTQRLKKEIMNEGVLPQTSLVLPRGKKVVLQAEEDNYDRGLIVELTNEGGYKIYYWYGEDIKIYPAEVEIDGQSIKPDAKEVYIKFHPELEKENIDPKSQTKHKGNSAPFGSAYEPVKEGDTYEKMAAKGKKRGNLKQGTVRKRLKIKDGEKIPLSKINKAISRIKKMKNPSEKNKKYLKALNLAKTLKTTTNINEDFIPSKAIIYPDFQGVDIDNNITGRRKVLNVVDCIGNEPNKDYNYFTTEKKDYVEDMVKNASGDGWKTFDPIVAIPHPLLNGKYLVIDGNHRLGAFVIGKLPKIKALVLSEDQILLAAPGSKWDGNNLPETIPLKDSKGKVNLKDYFSTEPLKVPTKENLSEVWEPQKAKVINKFLHFASDYLSTDRPKIKLLNGPEFTQTYHSFGGYHPGEENIQVVVYNRNMADILRTLAHEMVHRMQHLDNRLGPDSGDDGSPEENEANALAGVMLRQFGRENPGIYE